MVFSIFERKGVFCPDGIYLISTIIDGKALIKYFNSRDICCQPCCNVYSLHCKCKFATSSFKKKQCAASLLRGQGGGGVPNFCSEKFHFPSTFLSNLNFDWSLSLKYKRSTDRWSTPQSDLHHLFLTLINVSFELFCTVDVQ